MWVTVSYTDLPVLYLAQGCLFAFLHGSPPLPNLENETPLLSCLLPCGLEDA